MFKPAVTDRAFYWDPSKEGARTLWASGGGNRERQAVLRMLFKMGTESQSLQLFSEAEVSKVRTSLYFTKPQTQKKKNPSPNYTRLPHERKKHSHATYELN